MQIDDAAIILAGADFFEICTDEERRLLAFASERRSYAAGSTIVRPGVVPDGAQVLISGSISIVSQEDTNAEAHVVKAAGSVISAMALIVARPRDVTITAVDQVEMLLVPRTAFLKLARQSPDMARRASSRIRRDLGKFVTAVTPLRDKFSTK